MLTDLEQNRLALDHIGLVGLVAAQFRTQCDKRGVGFDEVVSEGNVGLTNAARSFDPSKDVQFKTWATIKIESAIKDFLKKWQDTVAPESFGYDTADAEDAYYEWNAYGHHPPYLSWTKLAATADELVALYEAIADDQQTFERTFHEAQLRERNMVAARFVRDPPQAIASIAREHRMSYERTVRLMKLALERMGDRASEYRHPVAA